MVHNYKSGKTDCQLKIIKRLTNELITHDNRDKYPHNDRLSYGNHRE